MKTVHKLLTVVLVCGFFVFAGCGQQAQVKNVERVCLSGLDKAKAVEVSEEILRDMNFMVAKAEPELGYVLSRPLAGGQFFELWRKDNVGSMNTAEANLHSIRRTVEVDVSQKEGRLCVGCNVSVQRLNLPERLLRGKGQSYEAFTASSPSMQKLKLDAQQRRLMAWVDLGRDELLETEILKRIEKKIAGLRKGK